MCPYSETVLSKNNTRSPRPETLSKDVSQHLLKSIGTAHTLTRPGFDIAELEYGCIRYLRRCSSHTASVYHSAPAENQSLLNYQEIDLSSFFVPFLHNKDRTIKFN